MKRIPFTVFCIALFAAASANCLDLTLKDGTVYENAVIYARSVDGIDVESHKDFDVRILRHVMYKELSPASLKLFPEYDKAKSEEYLESLRVKIEAAIARDAERKAEKASQAKTEKASVPPVVAEEPGAWLVFKSTKDLKHGSIGWGSTEEAAANGPTNQGHLGKIYVYGLKVTAGGEWAGKLYPTDKTVQDENDSFPCYATSQDVANAINKRSSL